MRVLFSMFLFLSLWSQVEAVKENRTSESFNPEWQTEHKALVGLGGAAAGTAILVILVLLGVRQAGLSWIISVWLWSVVLVVGIVAWVITYERMRTAIEDQVESLIYSIGSDMSSRVRREMEAAAVMVKQHKLLSSNGFVEVRSYDLAHHLLFLQSVWMLFEEFHRSISLFYYANNNNDLYSTSGNHDLWMVAPRGANFPATWTCVGNSPYTNCTSRTCGTHPQFDAQNCSNTCRLPSHSLCDGVLLDVPKFGFKTAVSTPTLGNLGSIGSIELQENTFNAHGRPWYVYTEEVIWSRPYVFTGPVAEPVIGLSATVGTRSMEGAFIGVAAADFQTTSLQSFVVALRPSTGSTILLILNDGVVITGTQSLNDLSNVTADGKLHLLNAWDAPATSVKVAMQALEKKVGRNIPRDRVSLIHDRDIAVLAQPITVMGDLRMYAIIMIPYSDVLQKAWDASTTSLIFVLVLSVGLSFLLAVVFTILLRPIQELDKAMGLVAWMMVDDLPSVTSRVAEIDSMSRSFDTMVANLIMYKQYLPQSLLAMQQEDNGSVASTSEASERVTKSSRSSLDWSQQPDGGLDAAARLKKEVFSTGLHRRIISILSVNVQGTHTSVCTDAKAYGTNYSEYLTNMQLAAQNNKGVVDNVSGDRVRISFNAVTQNTAHVMRACSAAWDSMKFTDCRFGISTGGAHVGNIGCKGMMKFSSFGNVVTNSIALSILAGETTSERCLLDERFASEAETFFETKKLFRVRFTTGKPILIRSLLGKKEGGEGEWMYALDGQERSGYAAYNEAVSALLSGDTGTANTRLKMSSCQAPIKLLLEARIKRVIRNGPEPPLELRWLSSNCTVESASNSVDVCFQKVDLM